MLDNVVYKLYQNWLHKKFGLKHGIIYQDVYDQLPIDFDNSYENLIAELPEYIVADPNMLYLFVLFSISKEETVQKHITAARVIVKNNPYVYDGSLSGVQWHYEKSLALGSCIDIDEKWRTEGFYDREGNMLSIRPDSIKQFKPNWYSAYELRKLKYPDKCFGNIYEILQETELQDRTKPNLEELVLFTGTQYGDYLYLFALYMVMRDETIHNHLLAIEIIMFMGCVADSGDWSLIFWHLSKAIKINNNDSELAMFIVNHFEFNPSSPFSKEEIEFYKSKINPSKSLF